MGTPRPHRARSQLLGCSLTGLALACTSGGRPARPIDLADERQFAADCAATFTVTATEWTRGAPFGGGNLYYLNNNFDVNGNLLLGNIAAIPGAGGGPVAFTRGGEVARTFNSGDDGAKSAVQVDDFLYFAGDDRQGVARVPAASWAGPASSFTGGTLESITTDGARIFANRDDVQGAIGVYEIYEDANGPYLLLRQWRSLGGGRIRGISYFDADPALQGDEYVYASNGAAPGGPRAVYALAAADLRPTRITDVAGDPLRIPGDAQVYQTVVGPGPGGVVVLAVSTVDRIYLYPMRAPTVVCTTPTVLATQEAMVGEQLMRWADGTPMPPGLYGLALAGEELYVASGDRISRLRLTATRVSRGGWGQPLSPLHPPTGAQVGGSGAILRVANAALGVNRDGTVGYQGVGLRELYEEYADDPMVHDAACDSPEVVRIDYEGVTAVGRDVETRTELQAPVAQPALGAAFTATHPFGHWSQTATTEQVVIDGAALRAQHPGGDIRIQLGAYWIQNSCEPPGACDSQQGCPEGTFRNGSVDPPSCDAPVDLSCLDNYTRYGGEPRYCGSKFFAFRNYRPPTPPWSTEEDWSKRVYDDGEFDWYYNAPNQCALFNWACANPGLLEHYGSQMYWGETTGYIHVSCGEGGWYYWGGCFLEPGVCPASPHYPRCPSSETGTVRFRIATPKLVLECQDQVSAEGSAQNLGIAVIDDQTGEITIENGSPSLQCEPIKTTPCGGHGWGVRLTDGTEAYASSNHGSENTTVEAFWATADTACSAVRVGDGRIRVERCFMPADILPDHPELPVFTVLTRLVNTGTCAGDCEVEFVEQVTWSGGDTAGVLPMAPVATRAVVASDAAEEYSFSVHATSAPPRPSAPPGELLFSGPYAEAESALQTMRVHTTARLSQPLPDATGEVSGGDWTTYSHLSMNTAAGDDHEAIYSGLLDVVSDIGFVELLRSREARRLERRIYRRAWGVRQGINDLRQVVGKPAQNAQGFANDYPIGLVPTYAGDTGVSYGSASLFVCRDVVLSTAHVYCKHVSGKKCTPEEGEKVGGTHFNLWNDRGGKVAQVELARTGLSIPFVFQTNPRDPPILARLAQNAPDWVGQPLLPASQEGESKYASLGVITPRTHLIAYRHIIFAYVLPLNPRMTQDYRAFFQQLTNTYAQQPVSTRSWSRDVIYPAAAIGITARGWTGKGMSGGPVINNVRRVLGVVQRSAGDEPLQLYELKALYNEARALSATKDCLSDPALE